MYASGEQALSSQLTRSSCKQGKIFNLVIHLKTKYFKKMKKAIKEFKLMCIINKKTKPRNN